MAVQQGRSKRRGEAYTVRYVEPLSDARTPLADFFSILLGFAIGGAFPDDRSPAASVIHKRPFNAQNVF